MSHAQKSNQALAPIERVKSAFPQHRVSSTGWYSACCSGHADTHASLSFREWEDGSVYFKCHAQDCSRESIIAGAGLQERDVFPKGYKPPFTPRPKLDIVELAYNKMLPWQFLFNLGIEDNYQWHNQNVVGITYYNLDGSEHPKKRVRTDIAGNKGSRWDEHTPGRMVPYGLQKLDMAQKQGLLFIGEGESDAWTCWIHDVPFLGVPGATNEQCLNGKDLFGIADIYIIQEPDKAGEQFYRRVHQQLRQTGYHGELYAFPFKKLLQHKDPNELHQELARLGKMSSFKDMLMNALPHAIPSGDDELAAEAERAESDKPMEQVATQTEEQRKDREAGRTTAEEQREETGTKTEQQTQYLIKMARQHGYFFPGTDGIGYERVSEDGHMEVYAVSEQAHKYKLWLVWQYEQETGFVPGEKALAAAMLSLSSRSHREGKVPEDVFVRIGHKNGNIYLDLCNQARQVIEITPNGWSIVEQPEINFKRPKGMQALPEPIPGGSLDLLEGLINADAEGLLLLKAWLIGCLHPSGPYAILGLSGERGSAKSTATEVLRGILDPATPLIRRLPDDPRTLSIAASNNGILAFDNLSSIAPWLSDTFCRISTGGGDAYRQLYTDNEEAITRFCRPIIYNGIEEIATRGDLLDRSILVHLPIIEDIQRRTKTEFTRTYTELHPLILGAILDAASTALRRLPDIQLEKYPRMADFAAWIVACEEHITDRPGHFMDSYGSNREEAVEIELEASPVAVAIRQLMETRTSNVWSGYAQDLLKALNNLVEEDTKRSPSWPKTPLSLGKKLARLATGLRETNIIICLGERTKAGRLLTIEQAM